MSTYSPIEKLIIIILCVAGFVIPGIIGGKKAAKKREEEDRKRKEENRKKQEEEDKKFREDKNNIANTIDQSIYDKVDFTDNSNDHSNMEKIVNWLNNIVFPKLFTSSYKKSIKDTINTEVGDYLDASYKNYMPTFKAEYFQPGIILVCDEDQEIREVCLFVTDDIASILRKAIGRPVGTGDGDEGCLYF